MPTLDDDGFAFVPAALMRPRLGPLPDWEAFTDSWDRLDTDKYLARVGIRRRRRHAVFSLDLVNQNPVMQLPAQAHFQSVVYNPLQGDVERWFEPIETNIAAGESLRTLILHGGGYFSRLTGAASAFVETHQFRIEADSESVGEPTPEGVHRDGVDFVFVLMIKRTNLREGTTTVHTSDGTTLGAFTLEAPFDAALVDDRRLKHGVTAVRPVDLSRPAFRDVVVVTYTRR